MRDIHVEIIELDGFNFDITELQQVNLHQYPIE